MIGRQRAVSSISKICKVLGYKNREWAVFAASTGNIQAERKDKKNKISRWKPIFEIVKTDKTDTIEILKDMSKLMDKEKITEDDYTKITEATMYLLNYFSETYADLKLSKEVSEVAEYVYTRGKAEGIVKGKKEGKAEGILEMATEMLKKGLDIELVSEVTKLPKEEIEKLLDKVNSQNN